MEWHRYQYPKPREWESYVSLLVNQVGEKAIQNIISILPSDSSLKDLLVLPNPKLRFRCFVRRSDNQPSSKPNAVFKVGDHFIPDSTYANAVQNLHDYGNEIGPEKGFPTRPDTPAIEFFLPDWDSRFGDISFLLVYKKTNIRYMDTEEIGYDEKLVGVIEVLWTSSVSSPRRV